MTEPRGLQDSSEAQATRSKPVLIPKRRMNRLVKILSIDGGGIRGIIAAEILAEIEKRMGRPIAGLFDLIAGTSTGGILALGLTIPKTARAPLYSARQLAGLFEREGSRIFSRSVWHRLAACGNLRREKYPSQGIEGVLSEYFGDARLRDAATPVLIASYEMGRGIPFFFRSEMARKRLDYDFAARDVARATSAAPTYFKPIEIADDIDSNRYTLIDGGVYANNPAACALVEARTTHPDAPGYLVVSLGTGELTHSLCHGAAPDWGVVQWAVPILDVVLDGVSKTVDYQLRQLLPDGPGRCQRYYRFQTTLDSRTSRLDNASPANLAALRDLAGSLVEKESDNLDRICDALAE